MIINDYLLIFDFIQLKIKLKWIMLVIRCLEFNLIIFY